MSQAEALYSAKQVASELKISSGMLRRYALAYEAITDDVIKQHPRDGRQYNADQLGVLQRAKAFVTHNSGMSVDQALKLAMGASEADVIAKPMSGDSTNAESLAVALERVVTPLLDEIRALRQSNERLTAALETQEIIRPSAIPENQQSELIEQAKQENVTTDDGPLVGIARRFEKLFRR